MKRCLLFLLAIAFASAPLTAQEKRAAGPPEIAAVVETSLKTEFAKKGGKQESVGHIRQFAFDGDPNTYFASATNPTEKDHFTLTFDKAVSVKSITVTTGRPKGEDKLAAGSLEVSADGKKFESLTKFKDGIAKAEPKAKQIKAIRIKPEGDQKNPLVIQEFKVES